MARIRHSALLAFVCAAFLIFVTMGIFHRDSLPHLSGAFNLGGGGDGDGGEDDYEDDIQGRVSEFIRRVHRHQQY